MSIHSQIATPLSKPPRLRFTAAMPAEDSTMDVSDAWLEETDEDADVTAYFRHSDDDHGSFCADLIGLKVQSDISLDLFTHDGAVAFLGWETVNRIEQLQTLRISE
ncbi:hypothetical protein phiGT1_47 [Sulfitobacter phage phiGT1]|nr:hypothetical protein phiGT1_47 [Sulfitobacter phage phiGT1]